MCSVYLICAILIHGNTDTHRIMFSLAGTVTWIFSGSNYPHHNGCMYTALLQKPDSSFVSAQYHCTCSHVKSLSDSKRMTTDPRPVATACQNDTAIPATPHVFAQCALSTASISFCRISIRLMFSVSAFLKSMSSSPPNVPCISCHQYRNSRLFFNICAEL
ncbi:uncharacterized protein F5147DRAFT_712609 [Suillus discolor]|uniref:Uncharacterized protein n=1 Tax=Suillus discolor TaxID=1912936 RepID=A0A9P7JQN7_9AGAM|nr:uncharacterized protein F5147DRAFT_712609 [Suillus discolor]KAG2099295.1 hypothetical protein F5147DRAFT_712609 [Suillus discolor]